MSDEQKKDVAALKSKVSALVARLSVTDDKKAVIDELRAIDVPAEAADVAVQIQAAITSAIAADVTNNSAITDGESAAKALTHVVHDTVMNEKEQGLFKSFGDHKLTALPDGPAADKKQIQEELEAAFARLKLAGADEAKREGIKGGFADAIHKDEKAEGLGAFEKSLDDLASLTNDGLKQLKKDLTLLKGFQQAELDVAKAGAPDDAKLRELNGGFNAILENIEAIMKAQGLEKPADMPEAMKKSLESNLQENKKTLRKNIQEEFIERLLLGGNAARKVTAAEIDLTGLPKEAKGAVAAKPTANTVA